MKPRRFYLAHPLDARKYIREWELKVEEKFGIELVNPFYDVKREDITKIDDGRAERYQVDVAEVVKRDLDSIKTSQAVLAIVDGSLSYGTIMEIVYGCLFCKPVYIIVTNGHSQHPWIKYHAQKVFSTLKGFERWLQKK